MATILRVACSTLHQSHVNKLASHIEKKQGEWIVFAFDGLDEYITHRQNEVDLDLLRGMSLNGAIILVTSRPAACTEFRQYAGKHNIEVLGIFEITSL